MVGECTSNSPPPPSLHPSVLILVVGITHVSKAFNNFIIFSQHFNSLGKKEQEKESSELLLRPLGMRCHIVKDVERQLATGEGGGGGGGERGGWMWGGVMSTR